MTNEIDLIKQLSRRLIPWFKFTPLYQRAGSWSMTLFVIRYDIEDYLQWYRADKQRIKALKKSGAYDL